jgi:uncharacterized protein (TIGR00730 family)
MYYNGFMAKVRANHDLRGPQRRSSELFWAMGVFLEIMKGFRTLHFVGPCVTVFGSARLKEDDPYYVLTKELGRQLAKVGFTVISGGGPGLMEAVNRGAKEMGGISVGCNIVLPAEQNPNPYLDIFLEFKHFFVRKLMLAKYSYAFVAAPGGFGTLDELFEVATLVQNQKMKSFPIYLLGSEYWKPLEDYMREKMTAAGTITSKDTLLIKISDDPREIAEAIKVSGLRQFGLTYGPKAKPRWFFLEFFRPRRRPL